MWKLTELTFQRSPSIRFYWDTPIHVHPWQLSPHTKELVVAGEPYKSQIFTVWVPGSQIETKLGF
jgi:hypothetical protein